tara:strand:- start:54 stop:170 length:117 start_codon:yes stop_codon:yes gene_type:complete
MPLAMQIVATAAAAYLVAWSLWHVLTTTPNTSTKEDTR